MKKIALVCLVFTCLCFACRKQREPETQRLDPAGMKYIQLRPNQFFIYKDSASGKTDSVVVTQSVINIEYQTSGGWFGPETVKREMYYLTLVEKGGVNDSIWIKGKAYGLGSLSASVTLQGDSGIFYFSHPVDNWRTDFYMLTTCSIEGVEYPNVIVANNVYANFTRGFYWAPLVGLIKVTKTEGSLPRQTYTLLRHN